MSEVRDAGNTVKGLIQTRGLIVDDDPLICDLLKKILATAGMEALALTESSEASSLLKENKFDLVFVDLHMPDPDGIELTRQMRRSRSNRGTPVILISDDQRPSALGIGFEAGASFFVYKPIDKDRLLKLVRATQGSIENERRRTRRVPVRHKVLLRFGTEELEAETIDISLNGMLVQAPRTFPPGSPVSLRLQLPKDSQPFTGIGSVARVAPANQMGIHLGRLSPAESERLQGFLLPLIPDIE